MYFDVVTLALPTWKNRANGLRPDLGERLAALNFKYIQFPGGCTAESASMDACWNWKNSIDLSRRKTRVHPKPMGI